MPRLLTTASPANLPRVMSFVERSCQELGLNGSTAYTVRLAVEEICINIMSYGYAGREAGPLEVRLQLEKPNVVVRIGDRGVPFSPDDAPAPDLTSDAEHRRIGGLGMHLIREMMDEVSYRSTDGANELTMVKRVG